MDTCATCPPYSRGCADEPTSTSFVDRGCEEDGAEERAYEGQLHGRPQIVISRDRKGRSNMLPRRTASTGVTGCPARPQRDRNPFKVTGGCAGEWKLERQPGKVGCDVKTQKRTRHMHRWMSTTALDWRGRARGRQVAPSGPRAGSRSARRTPVAQSCQRSFQCSSRPPHAVDGGQAVRRSGRQCRHHRLHCGNLEQPHAGSGTAGHCTAPRCSRPSMCHPTPPIHPT